jgi:hypothetical protein
MGLHGMAFLALAGQSGMLLLHFLLTQTCNNIFNGKSIPTFIASTMVW